MYSKSNLNVSKYADLDIMLTKKKKKKKFLSFDEENNKENSEEGITEGIYTSFLTSCLLLLIEND